MYDVKLLWRAELYIDERPTGAQLLGSVSQDWNDLHPWNAPPGDPMVAANVPVGGVPWWWTSDWGYNEWNRAYDGTQTFDGSVSGLSGLPGGNGGQVVNFPTWTKYNKGIFNSKKGSDATAEDDVSVVRVQGAVAYTSNDTDSPFRFAWELVQQRHAVKDLKQADSTQAPGNKWTNYIGHSVDESDVNHLTTSTCGGINWTGYTPYRPNYSAILKFDKKFANGCDWFPGTEQSSGLDCGALVWVAWSYSGNPYQYPYSPAYGMNWSAAAKDNPGSCGPLQIDDGSESWLIWDHTVLSPEQKGKYDTLTFNFPIVPGDVIVMTDKDGDLCHTAVVQSVHFEADGTFMVKDITFIEAASGAHAEYRVLDGESLKDYVDTNWLASFRIRRLIAR